MNKREVGRRIAEELFLQGKSREESRRKEDAAARQWWDHQEVAQILKIPVTFRTLQGNTIKVFPLGETSTNTNDK